MDTKSHAQCQRMIGMKRWSAHEPVFIHTTIVESANVYVWQLRATRVDPARLKVYTSSKDHWWLVAVVILSIKLPCWLSIPSANPSMKIEDDGESTLLRRSKLIPGQGLCSISYVQTACACTEHIMYVDSSFYAKHIAIWYSSRDYIWPSYLWLLHHDFSASYPYLFCTPCLVPL